MTERRATELARQDSMRDMFLKGHSYKQIAQALGMKYNTVASFLWYCGMTKKRKKMVLTRRTA